MVTCLMCTKETEDKEQGICLKCKQKIFASLDMKVEYLDKEPYVKVTPKTKENLFEFIDALSRLAGSVDFAWHRLEHHTHSTREIEVVNFE